MLKRLIDKLNSALNLPYYWDHVIVALVIGGAAWVVTQVYLTAFAGGVFYIVREFIQWKELGYLDKKGLIYPVVAAAILTGIAYALA